MENFRNKAKFRKKKSYILIKYTGGISSGHRIN